MMLGAGAPVVKKGLRRGAAFGYGLLMLEPTHFMTLRTSDINGPLRIAPPE